MPIQLCKNGAVRCETNIVLALTPTQVWGQLRDFRRFASHDFFHHDVRVEGGVPRQSARLRLAHRFAGIHVQRHGRIVWWKEGKGFAFSDLSHKGNRTGFPHVFIARITETSESTCTLKLSVRGRWTAGFIPLWMRKLWLTWVFSYIESRVRELFLTFEAATLKRRECLSSDLQPV